MSKKMSPVVHFEMPYENRDRMVSFYEKAFGWSGNKLGPEMGDYAVMMTSEEDPETKMPKKPGMINGGFYKKTKENQMPSIVIGVENIREAMKHVEEAGGKILGGMKAGEPDTIPGVGLFVGFIDTEGNRVAMLQPTGV